MKRTILIAAASTVVLAACAVQPLYTGPRITNVTVDNNYIVIDQEPIVVRGKAPIRWNITTPGYEFAQNGIEFKNPGPPYANPANEFSCRAQRAVFTCDAAYIQRKAAFRYTIRVVSTRSGVASPPELDPTVMND